MSSRMALKVQVGLREKQEEVDMQESTCQVFGRCFRDRGTSRLEMFVNPERPPPCVPTSFANTLSEATVC